MTTGSTSLVACRRELCRMAHSVWTGRSRRSEAARHRRRRSSLQRISKCAMSSVSTARWSPSGRRQRRPRSACTRGLAPQASLGCSLRRSLQVCGEHDARVARPCSRRAILEGAGVHVSIHSRRPSSGGDRVVLPRSFSAISLNVRLQTLGERNSRGRDPLSARTRGRKLQEAARAPRPVRWTRPPACHVVGGRVSRVANGSPTRDSRCSIVDGRGTPGRGPEWDQDRCVADYAAPSAAKTRSTLPPRSCGRCGPTSYDLTRVAIRGWSFGGFLVALAVIRRPDVFHVAIAGAPVTDDHLYDTHYTERYLGHPDVEPDNYAAVSLVDDAARLTRPPACSSTRTSVMTTWWWRTRCVSPPRCLLAGREHTVLPLTGATHMANDETVAESNFLHLELEFIRRALNHGRIARADSGIAIIARSRRSRVPRQPSAAASIRSCVKRRAQSTVNAG